MLEVSESSNYDNFPILKEEVETAVSSLKSGKEAGVDNIPAELKNRVEPKYLQHRDTESGMMLYGQQ